MTANNRINPTQARAVQTLQRIEAAALQVLAEHGRDRFSTGDVAKVAGYSIGTLYRYFADRVALLDHIWPDRDLSVPEAVATPMVVGQHSTITGVLQSVEVEPDDGSEGPRRTVVTLVLD
jgi:Bacterial regulatory proteins, tetR family